MPTYLLKTEPGTYSYSDLVKEKRTVWSGVANPAALATLRTARKGDEAYIYHTGDEKAIVGLAQVISDPYEDPDDPGVNAQGLPKAAVVDLKPLRAVKTPVTLAALKADARFKMFDLVRLPRLSVMLVPADLDAIIRKLTGVGS
jgi:predicted RNA-binding protein with PUA-like domain